MRAALLKEFHQDFVIEEVDAPEVKDNEALVKVKAACLCATDLKIKEGHFPGLRRPLIPGHEVVGEVVEVGGRAKNVKAGDRVAVYMYTVCGECTACLRGRDNLCKQIALLGFARSGGFAEYVAVPASQLMLLPDHIPYREAAAIPDAVSTMLHAIRDRGQVRLLDNVVIVGAGGLGMQGIQIAQLCGGRVIAVARSEEKLKVARALGAEWGLNGRDENLADQIIDLTHGQGADVVIDLVGTLKTFETSANCLKKGGTIVVVGAISAEMIFAAGKVIFGELTVKGSSGTNKQTMIDAIDLCASGKIKPLVTEEYPLEQINEAAKKLQEGKVVGRAVIIP